MITASICEIGSDFGEEHDFGTFRSKQQAYDAFINKYQDIDFVKWIQKDDCEFVTAVIGDTEYDSIIKVK